jgi:hypothetical protein
MRKNERRRGIEVKKVKTNAIWGGGGCQKRVLEEEYISEGRKTSSVGRERDGFRINFMCVILDLGILHCLPRRDIFCIHSFYVHSVNAGSCYL